jgi:hypothetical protein
MIEQTVKAEQRPNVLYYVLYHRHNEGEWKEDHAWFWSDAPHWAVINLDHIWDLE